MEITATLREAVATYKASKEAFEQAIQRRDDTSSGPRESFAKATDEFVAILVYSCEGLVALLPSDYGKAYEGIQFASKECFDLISPATVSKLPEDQKSYFEFVLKLSGAMLQPREANIAAALAADTSMPDSRRSIMIEQFKRSAGINILVPQKLAAFIACFQTMESDIEMLFHAQLRNLNEAAALHSIGHVYIQKGDLDRALRYYESDLVITQRLAPGSLDEAATLGSIGHVYRNKGDLDRALRYYESALVIFQRLAPGSLDKAKMLDNNINM